MLTIDKERCKGCGLCVPVCPKKIMRISETEMNSFGYHPAELTDAQACTSCAVCALMCPDVAIIIGEEGNA
jgi:2-oxoglutarate ferredoxin oxidoreductase subunit delta